MPLDDQTEAHYQWLFNILKQTQAWTNYNSDLKHSKSKDNEATGAYLYFSIHDAAKDVGIRGAANFASGVFGGHTGITNYGQYQLEEASEQDYPKALKAIRRSHRDDAEARALQALAAAILAKTGNRVNGQDQYPSIIGTAILASTQGPCLSCRTMITAFTAIFPGIQLVIIHPTKARHKCTCCGVLYGYSPPSDRGQYGYLRKDGNTFVTFFAKVDGYVHWNLSGRNSQPVSAGMDLAPSGSRLCCSVDLHSVAKRLMATGGTSNIRTAIHTLGLPSEAIDGTIRLVLRGAPCPVCRVAFKYGFIAFFPNVTFTACYLADAIVDPDIPSLKENAQNDAQEGLKKLLQANSAKPLSDRPIKAYFTRPGDWRAFREYIGYKNAALAGNKAVFVATFKAPSMKWPSKYTAPWTYVQACQGLFARMRKAAGSYAQNDALLSVAKEMGNWDVPNPYQTWETILVLLAALRNNDGSRFKTALNSLTSTARKRSGSQQLVREPITVDQLVQLVRSIKNASGVNDRDFVRLLELGARAYVSDNELKTLSAQANDITEGGEWETVKRRGR